MTDLQLLVKQTSNTSILKMQQRLHEEVVQLGKQALKWKADYEALQLAFETERGAANLYAKQVAHWIEKHDALLAQQLETKEPFAPDACKTCKWHYKDPDMKPCNTCENSGNVGNNYEPRIYG